MPATRPPMPSLPEHPPFKLSASGIAEYEQCPRCWWLHNVAAWQGWPGGLGAGDEESRLAYEGTKLHTLATHLGQLVHESAQRVVEATRRGDRLPDARALAGDW